LCKCNFSFDIIRGCVKPVADSTSNRNEYQEYFLTIKAAGA
jgi:hypothetical protein